MNPFHQWVGKNIEIEIAGKKQKEGILIDTGLDIMVLYSKEKFFYIPLVHVQSIKSSARQENELLNIPDVPIHHQTDSISYRKILDNAKGRFIELYVTGNNAIHGYLTSIMNDYFAFYSPIYKTVFVPLDHVKWVVPYPFNATPYSLQPHHFPVSPVSIPLSRSFEQQCKRLEGNLVVFDLGDQPDKIGLLEKVESSKVEMKNANGETLLWNLQHLKTLHVPGLS
jgi:hypothetical protein